MTHDKHDFMRVVTVGFFVTVLLVYGQEKLSALPTDRQRVLPQTLLIHTKDSVTHERREEKQQAGVFQVICQCGTIANFDKPAGATHFIIFHLTEHPIHTMVVSNHLNTENMM